MLYYLSEQKNVLYHHTSQNFRVILKVKIGDYDGKYLKLIVKVEVIVYR